MKTPLLFAVCFAALLAISLQRLAADVQGADSDDARPIDFSTQILPIFQRSCLSCHGPDKQKGDLRLDIRESAFTRGDSYAPNIVAGKGALSPLIQFVSGTGDLVMPPEGDRLTDNEITLLRTWIDQGARWPDEVAGRLEDKADLWSLKPLVRPPVPASGAGDLSPIDAFIRQKLSEHGFPAAPAADRRTLIRRVTLNLTGLPPSPEEVDRFEQDSDPQAYEMLVDRLLASPHYGERWARHWLDAAHFAETHGNDQDRIREHAWPYRDYLIRAFNDDQPYDRFVAEQVAGDVLEPEAPAALPALGFLAAGPWDESSLRDIREDTLDRQIARYLDRDDMLSNVINNFCSLTVQCARCHDHKFDPISQHDYYSLQAIFSGVERANRRYDADPKIHRQRLALLRKKQELEHRAPDQPLWLESVEVQQHVEKWERGLAVQEANWTVIDADGYTSSDGATLTKLPDGSILSGGPRPDKDTVTIYWNPFETQTGEKADRSSKNVNGDSAKPTAAVKQITAVRLEVLTDDRLPRRGPGRQENGNLHLSEFEIYTDDRTEPLTLVNPTADFNQQGWEIAKSIDQNEPTAWGIDPQEGSSHRAVFELKVPIQLSQLNRPSCRENDDSSDKRQSASRLRFVLKQLHGRGHLIGRLRLSVTSATPRISIDALPESIADILALPPSARTEHARWQLAAYQQLEEVTREVAALPAQSLIYAAAADFEPDGSLKPPPGPRPIHLLHRGDIRNPREEVLPGALSCLAGIPARFEISSEAPESARRAALAQWLVHHDNVLTWRSIVNRVWHHHFGRGLVPTLNDFGHMGERPSHPELLDWLAVEFRDSGQSLKQLHRMIVTSRTYKQSVHIPGGPSAREERISAADPATLDADNRLLWRMNRNRMDAESLRDSILAIAGRLDLRMGGPSDRQFDLQPGIHVTPKVDYLKFDPGSAAGRRRSIYRFLFRTLPDPFMESLDCPSGDQITAARTNSVTVQQALSLWNDLFVTRHCEEIAARIDDSLTAKPVPGTLEDRLREGIQQAFRSILLRSATTEEIEEIAPYVREHGLANLCRLLLNSNEFMFVN